ncbi:MAG: alcohol dehydrogenase catalytic domain-containing protein [Kiritimatiellia bacterium]|jgi:L-iditol 2-dehydrogenase|nr:alcohol dehydrogenase catalytic domain-containing protein [Kiritimatiellia bacterium]
MMRAVVYHGKGDVRVERVPVPVCGEGGLRVKVEACAVCGSDMKAYKSGNPRMRPPIVMGHEFAGVVVESRAGAAFRVGERVVMATSVACGACAYCARGWRNLCANLRPMGFGYDGGMAECVAIPEAAVRGGHVIRVPASADPALAALAEPLSCAVNACENSGVGEGDTVLVMGAGPMGILNAVAARARGAGRVILSEINPARLAQCGAFGFDRLVNPAVEDLAQAVRDATGGLGADVVIVAAPAAAPQEQALSLVRKRGTLCLFASLPAGKSMLSLDSRLIHYHELRVIGSSDSAPPHVAQAVALLASGAFPAERLVTHRLPLEGFHEAVRLMERGEALRVVLTP